MSPHRMTRLNGFLMDCDLAHAILRAVATHAACKSHPGCSPDDAELCREIDRMVESGHTQTATRELVSCLKHAPGAIDYLARRLFEAK